MTAQASSDNAGTAVITGATGGLGRALAVEMANRPLADRPDLLLVGRAGKSLADVTETVRAAGATAYEVPCDLSRLSEVRAAAGVIKGMLSEGQVRPLHGLAANAGLSSIDSRVASADGYEMTFAVNYLAHAELIGDLLGSFTAPARIVLVGSDTYYVNTMRRMMQVPAAEWRDPVELARPAPADSKPSVQTAGIAYSNSKLAIIYYAHELQRRAPEGIHVIVFEPGWMPGTGLSRQQSPALQRISRLMAHLPGISSPTRAAPAFASVILDPKWSHLRDGAYVVLDKETDVQPFAKDREREGRLWEATAELLGSARSADSAMR